MRGNISRKSRLFQILLGIFFTISIIQESKAQTLISRGQTIFDGVNQDLLPSYYSLDGQNGIRALLDNRRLSQSLDYFIRLWIKPQYNYGESNPNKTQSLLQFNNSLQCYFRFDSKFICTSFNASIGNQTLAQQSRRDLAFDISNMKDKTWIHVAIGGEVASNSTYIRMDYQDQILGNISGPYLPLIQVANNWNITLGSNSSNQTGFIGQVRELFLASAFVNQTQVGNIKNQIITYNPNQLGNFRMNQGSLIDSYRPSLSMTLLNQTVTNVPIWSYDHQSNDMCYPFIATVNIPRLDNLRTSSATIDSRMSNSITNFQYTGSFWMRLQPGMITSSAYSSSAAFFILSDSFALWFSGPQSIRIYFFASRAFEERFSDEVFLPLNQWFNLQFTIDRTQGYDIRIYDLQRTQLSRVTQTIFLAEQRPSRQFTLIQNIRGFVKSIMVYQAKKALPVDQSVGETTTIKDSNLIIYYKLDSTNFISGSLQSLGLNSNNPGPSITFNGTLSFEQVEWEERLNYTTPSTLGSLQQNISLYDGLSCNDTALVMRTTFRASRIQSQLELRNLTQASVELWMRRPIHNQALTHCLFSLYSVNQTKEYMALYQTANSNDMTCKPIDARNSTNTNLIQIQGMQSNYTGWQHFTCKFRSSYQIAGVYNNDQDIERFYHLDAENITLQIPQGSYIMEIGNSYGLNMSQEMTRYKEVRFWTQFREDSNIKRFLYRQINPSLEPNLISYFRLNAGTQTVQNYPTQQNGIQVNTTSMELVAQEVPHLICPINSYYNYRTKVCVRNPFIDHRILVIPTIEEGKVQSWTLTQNFSDTHTPFKMRTLNYKWTSPNTTLGIMGNTTETLRLNSSLISNNSSQYQVKQELWNSQRTFFSEKQLNFTGYNCRFMVFNDTLQTNAFKHFITAPGATEINILMKQVSVNNCETKQDRRVIFLDKQLQVQLYPSYLGLNASQIAYDSNSGIVSLNITQQDQLKIGKYQDLTVVITAYWNVTNEPEKSALLPNKTNDNKNDSDTKPDTNGTRRLQSNQTQNKTYESFIAIHNLVYKIRFVDEIKPILVYYPAEDNMIDEDFFLEADKSYFKHLEGQGNSQSGISYQWFCPLIFDKFCSDKLNQKRMRITYRDFLESRAPEFNIPYLFGLSVWKSSEDDQQANFTMIISNYWQNFHRPIFSFEIAGSDKLYSSQENIIALNFPAYDINDPKLIKQWSITPALEPQFYEYLDYNTKLKIHQGGLKSNQLYTFSVYTLNQTFPLANYTNTLKQMITEPPSNGSVSITPMIGTSYETNFTVKVSNWSSLSSSNIKYRVFGAFSNDLTLRYLIKDFYYVQLNSDIQPFISQLPEFQQIIVEISDDIGEKTYITTDVTITQNFSVSILDILSATCNQSLPLSQASLERVQMTLWQIVNKGSLSIKTESSALVLQYLLDKTSQFTVANDETNDTTIKIQKLIVNILRHVSDMHARLNDKHVLQGLEILKNTQVLMKALKLNMKEEQFQQDYMRIISNFLQYSINRFKSISNTRRLLQSNITDAPSSFTKVEDLNNFIYDLLIEKDNFASYYCDQINTSQKQYRVSTSLIDLTFERHPNTSLVWNRTYFRDGDQSTVQIPILRLVQDHRALRGNSFTSFCTFSTYFNFNPLVGFNFTNIEIISAKTPVVQTQSIDNGGLRLIDDIGIIGQNRSIWTSRFVYDFNDTTNRFSNNQTVCLQIDSQQFLNKNKTWSFQRCQTQYQVQEKAIICRCRDLSQSLLAIGNDYTRMPILIKDDKDYYNQLLSAIKQFDGSIVPVLLVIIVLAVVFPCLAVCLDNKDYAALKHDSYRVTDDFIRKVAIKKRQPYELVIYSKRRFSRLIGIKQIGFCTLFRIFTAETHPLISLFTRFDIELKRMIRFVLVTYQICIVAIISGFAFGTTYRSDERELAIRNERDDTDNQNALVTGFLIGIVSLPIAQKLVSCLKSRLVSEINMKRDKERTEQDIKRQKGNKKKPVDKNKNSPDGVSQDFDGVQDIEEGKIQHTQQRLKTIDKSFGQENTITNLDTSKIEEPVVIIDSCIPCKLMLILFSFILCLLALILVSLQSGDNPKSHSECMTIAFFTALLVGYFIYNFVLIILQCIFVPRIVSQELEDGEVGGCLKFMACLFVSDHAKEVMRDILLVSELNQHAELVVDDSRQISQPDNKGKNGSNVKGQSKQSNKDLRSQPKATQGQKQPQSRV